LNWFACLELEGGEGVGGAGEQSGGMELLLEAVAEAAPGLRVQHQPPRRFGRIRRLPGRGGAEEAGSGWKAARRDEADGRRAREEGERRRHDGDGA
jgi:hypothetical protein